MKTAKQTADELIGKFNKITGDDFDILKRVSKQCALIYVEGIITELNQLRKPEYTSFIIRQDASQEVMDGYEKKEFWNEVKSELEK